MRDENEMMRLDSQLFIQAALGNIDEAFKALMRLAEMHYAPNMMKYRPIFAELRRDPRFLEFCKKVRLSPQDIAL